jgi:tetratricopeptide (TPR) repeat protein
MSRHDTKLPEGLVTSDVVQDKRRLVKRPRHILVISVIVIVLGSAGISVYRFHNAPMVATKSTYTKTQGSNATLINPQLGVNAAQRTLQAAHTSQEKAAAYLDLGDAYFNNHQANEAIAAYQSALNADSSLQIPALSSLGYAYAMAGERSQAINVFQKLISILGQSHDPAASANIAIYQNAIQQLQAGKTTI